MRIEIFDPPMCCSSGICGPAVDDKLVKIQEDLEAVKKEFDGLEVARYQLTQQPLKFRKNEEIFALVRADRGVLPITTVNGQIIKKQGYPTIDELRNALNGDVHA